MIKTEQDLQTAVKKLCPGTERIENSIKFGQPDCLIPGPNGWNWVELKMYYGGGYLIFQKSQLAWWARASRLHPMYWPLCLVCQKSDNQCVMYTLPDILQSHREPYGNNKVKVMHSIHLVAFPLVDVLVNFGYIPRSVSLIDKNGLYSGK